MTKKSPLKSETAKQKKREEHEKAALAVVKNILWLFDQCRLEVFLPRMATTLGHTLGPLDDADQRSMNEVAAAVREEFRSALVCRQLGPLRADSSPQEIKHYAGNAAALLLDKNDPPDLISAHAVKLTRRTQKLKASKRGAEPFSDAIDTLLFLRDDLVVLDETEDDQDLSIGDTLKDLRHKAQHNERTGEIFVETTYAVYLHAFQLMNALQAFKNAHAVRYQFACWQELMEAGQEIMSFRAVDGPAYRDRLGREPTASAKALRPSSTANDNVARATLGKKAHPY